jgi:hypothetical protein
MTTIRFPVMSLRPPKPGPNLLKLNSEIERTSLSVPKSILNFPLQPVSELAQELLGSDREYTTIEVMRLVHASQSELGMNAKSLNRLGLRLWNKALKNPSVYTSMISLVANQCMMNQSLEMGPEKWIMQALNHLESESILACQNPLLRELLTTLKGENVPLQVMKLSHKEANTPWGWLASHYVSLQPDSMARLIPFTIKALEPIDNINPSDATWLVDCLSHANENKLLKVRLAQELLTALPKRVDRQVGLKPLVQWFQVNFKRGSDDWASLNSEAKERLSSWLGALTYNDFSLLIENVKQLFINNHIKIVAANNIKKLDQEINRLNRRKDFWDAYKSSFSHMRVLFPNETINHLTRESKDLLNISEVEILGVGEQVEVCIFELKQYIIAEVFRGDVTELFVFDNTPLTRKILFTENIGLDQLRADDRLIRVRIFDHQYLWQGEVQRWLFHEGIPTAPHVKKFKGLPDSTRFVDGLTPMPPERRQLEREGNLRRWNASRELLVSEARDRLAQSIPRNLIR